MEERERKTYLGVLNCGDSSVAQQLGVLWHQDGAGVVSRRLDEQRVGGAGGGGGGAQRAGELGDGGGDARHCFLLCLLKEKRC